MSLRIALFELPVPLVHVCILEPDGAKELNPLVDVDVDFWHSYLLLAPRTVSPRGDDTILHCEAVDRSSAILPTVSLLFRAAFCYILLGFSAIIDAVAPVIAVLASGPKYGLWPR
jgi:hypothetical protein